MSKFCIVILLLVTQLSWAKPPQQLTLYGRPAFVPLEMHISDADWRWLGKKQMVTIATWDSENPPLDIALDSGIYEGIYADYLKVIITNLGVRCTILRYTDRQRAMEALAAGQVDIMIDDPGVMEKLPPDLAATSSLIDNRMALVRQQVAKNASSGDSAFTLAVSDTYLSDKQIKALFPRAQVVRFVNNAEALAAVAYHRIDAALGNLTSFNFLIDRNFNNELSISRILPETGSGGRLVMRREDTSLLTSINAAIAAFPPHMAKSITDEWFMASDYAWLSTPDNLTAEEKAWVKSHPVVDVVADPLYAPITVQDQDHTFRGISSDVLHLISLRTGLTFRLRAASDVREMVNTVSKSEAEMLAALTWSSERSQQVILTRPYLFSSYVLIVADTQIAPTEIRPNMTLAVATGNVIAEDLRRKYPDIRIISAPNASLALKMVDEGKADAAVNNQAVADFLIDRYFKGRLRIASQVGPRRAEISFGVSRHARELESILNKSLADIPPRELAKIAIKWQGIPMVNMETWRNYSNWHMLVLTLSGLMLVGMLIWALTLRRTVITRKKAQVALLDELAFREILLNGSPDPIYVIDKLGNVTSRNQAWQSFFNTTDPQALTLPLFDSRHPLSPVLPALLPLLNSETEGQKAVHRQQCKITVEGQQRILVHWAAPMPKSGKNDGLVCGWQDITENEKLLESFSSEKARAERASKAKGTFLATMSHEIRTPVSAIIGLLELAESARTANTPEGEAIRLAYTSAQSLLELIGDVLDLAKIESGSLELTPAWSDPVQLCQQTLSIFEALAHQKGLTLEFDNQLSGGQEYWIDVQRLRQIIFNFLSNSLKFTFIGQVGIRLSESRAGEETQLIIEVFDSGIGISADDQPKLFQPYSQLDEGKKHGGTGLGLVISAELTRMLGGTLTLNSTLHKGTSITVSLPVVWREMLRPATASQKPQAHTTLSLSLHILVVDDHETNRLILRRQLQRLGCHVTEAADGEEAMLFLEDEAFDLMITDCQMPVMDGIALTHAVRLTDKTLPIWGLTANAQSTERERCLAAGMNECLFKPLLPDDLKARLLQMFPDSETAKPVLARLIDFEQLTYITGDNKEQLVTLLSRAFEKNQEDFSQLTAAISAGDSKTILSVVHRMRGAADVLGAVRLRNNLRAMEEQVEKKASMQALMDAADPIAQTLQRIDEAFSDYLQI
ncbi:TPA: transporter substrate-binding domain-containing protein [Enterobacter kobei]|nr:transporter substrate-binding domain-containing protein [Enterobacter kobei]